MAAENANEDHHLVLKSQPDGSIVVKHYKLADTVALEPETVKTIAEFHNARLEKITEIAAGGIDIGKLAAIAKKQPPASKPTRKPQAKK
ncbi:MAG: hypothetical protein HRF49_07900 [bacterium]|jgi:hypothetical protein